MSVCKKLSFSYESLYSVNFAPFRLTWEGICNYNRINAVNPRIWEGQPFTKGELVYTTQETDI